MWQAPNDVCSEIRPMVGCLHGHIVKGADLSRVSDLKIAGRQ